MSLRSMLDVLRPKTKTSATVTLLTCAVFLVTYFVWTDYFLIASIYIAVYAPLLLVLFVVFDLLFSSVYGLWNLSKVSPVTPVNVNPNYSKAPVSNNMLDMESAI